MTKTKFSKFPGRNGICMHTNIEVRSSWQIQVLGLFSDSQCDTSIVNYHWKTLGIPIEFIASHR